VGELGYYTHHQDANLDLLQLGVRFYDPEIGRFTQRDPVYDPMDGSAYPYVENRPTLSTDPAGLKSYWEHEKEFLTCVRKCLGIPSAAGIAGAIGKAFGLCFKRGKWVGWHQCAKALCKGTKDLAKKLIKKGKSGKAGFSQFAKKCALVAELVVLACEAKCYWKLLNETK